MNKTFFVLLGFVILMVTLLAACTPITRSPNNLNDALVDACRDNSECWSDAMGESGR